MERNDKEMIIKLLEENDNIFSYLECVQDLNSYNVSVSTVEQIKEILGSRPSNILTFVGVLSDGSIVATATILVEKKLRYNSLCFHIEDVGVHPSHRNNGYGMKIVQYCIDVAKSNNAYKIKLNCSADLIRFYEKLGFVRDNSGMVCRL